MNLGYRGIALADARPRGVIGAAVPGDDSTELTDGARRLLLGPIDSFEKLDLILVLRSSEDSPLRLDDLEARGAAPTAVLTRALEELAAASLAQEIGGRWTLAPGCDRQAIDELAGAWSSKRTEVLNVITQRSLESIRASAARAFADAFNLRRADRGGRGDGDG